MKQKKFVFLRKLISAILLITIVVVPTMTSVIYGYTTEKKISLADIIMRRYNNVNDYKKFFGEMNTKTQRINKNISVDEAKKQMLEKIEETQKKYSDVVPISIASSKLYNNVINANDETTIELLSTITNKIQSLSSSSNLAIQSLTPDLVVDNMKAATAGKLAGSKYNVKLSGKVYYHDVNSNGKPVTNNWVVLVHGNMMNGQAIADALGEMYLEQGFNVLAPDLRGFGDSEGSVAMGYLESLDIWDWLTYLNENYNCKEIVVHGVSLGGATTVQLSGFSHEGKTLKQQNVIGLVEDCGYSSMTEIITGMLGIDDDGDIQEQTDSTLVSKMLGIADKTDLAEVKNGKNGIIKTLLTSVVDTGLTNENFDELQDGLKSLEKCEVPLLIVHGDKDSTVPFDNSEKIYNTAMKNNNIPYVQRFTAKGEQHAFIILGAKYNVYEGHVKNFIQKVEAIQNGEKVNKVSDYKEEDEKKSSMTSSLVRALKLLKNMLKK